MNSAGVAAREDILVIEGMFCSACAAGVEAALQKLPGVHRAAVSFAADAAVIEWHTEQRNTQALLSAVTRLGYQPRLLDGSEREQSSSFDPTRGLQLRLVIALFFGMWMMLPTLGLYIGVSPDPKVNFWLALAAGTASLPVLLYSGYPFYRMGLLTLRGGVPGVDALITIGVLASVGLSIALLCTGRSDVYFEVAVSLITLQLIARLIDARVRRKAQDAVLQLLKLSPSRVQRLDEGGTAVSVALEAIAVGDTVLVRAGQGIAVDGEVQDGFGSIDRSLLTGESAAQSCQIGDQVQAGMRLLDGYLLLRVTGAAGKRRIDQLAQLVRSTLATRPAWQKKTDAIARSFLWIAGTAATLSAGLALVSGADGVGASERALAVFVIACPCALSLATPLAGLVAAAAATKQRFALRDLTAVTGGVALTHVFFDKTGTLTEGRPQIVHVHSFDSELDADTILSLAAEVEQGSLHPLAQAIVDAAEGARRAPAFPPEGQVAVAPGSGVTLETGEVCLRVGSEKWLSGLGYELPVLDETVATRAWVARNDRVIGAIDLEDRLRVGVPEAMAELRARGIQLTILSGDQVGPVQTVAQQLGLAGVSALNPEEKDGRVRHAQADGGCVAFVGDGLNDGPALAAADLGVAVANASDVAANASAVTMLEGGAERLPELLRLLAGANRTARRNVVFALLYNAVAIPFAVAGLVQPVIAALAMAASSLTVIASSSAIHRQGLAGASRAQFAGTASRT